MKSAEYEALLDNVPGIVYRCRLDADWTMLYVSDGARDLTGYRSEDFVLNKTRTFESVIDREDTDRVSRAIRKAVKKKRVYTIEYRIIRSDGEIRWVFECGRAEFDENGDPFQLIGAILDISAAHATQVALETEKEHFRQAIENIPGVVYRVAVADQWEIELLSDNAEALLGVDPDEKVGTDLRDFYREMVHPDDIEILLQMVERAVQSGTPYELKYRVQRPDGSSRWVIEKGQAQTSESNLQRYLSGVILDRSQSHSIQEELKEIKQRLLN